MKFLKIIRIIKTEDIIYQSLFENNTIGVTYNNVSESGGKQILNWVDD